MKASMDKYEEAQKDDELWSAAMAIQVGEACYRYDLKDSFGEGKTEGEEIGIQKGRISLLLKLLKGKYHEDYSAWLLSLNDEQMEAVSSLILVCSSFQELKNQVTVMK